MGDDERPARGYSKRGEPCIGKKPAFAKQKMNMMAALCQKRIIEPLLYTGNCTALLVEEWFRQRLLPALVKGTVIIMDNAPFHRRKILKELAEKAGHTIEWLPPYSPEMNDMEPWWAVIKNHTRKFMQQNENAKLHEALDYVFGVVQ